MTEKRENRLATPVDEHVGSRARLRRTLLGMSRELVGTAIGTTWQQVQKYERGVNRISASRLFVLANALDVPPSFLFDDMPEDIAAKGKSENLAKLAQPEVTQADADAAGRFMKLYKDAKPEEREACLRRIQMAIHLEGPGG